MTAYTRSRLRGSNAPALRSKAQRRNRYRKRPGPNGTRGVRKGRERERQGAARPQCFLQERQWRNGHHPDEVRASEPVSRSVAARDCVAVIARRGTIQAVKKRGLPAWQVVNLARILWIPIVNVNTRRLVLWFGWRYLLSSCVEKLGCVVKGGCFLYLSIDQR